MKYYRFSYKELIVYLFFLFVSNLSNVIYSQNLKVDSTSDFASKFNAARLPLNYSLTERTLNSTVDTFMKRGRKLDSITTRNYEDLISVIGSFETLEDIGTYYALDKLVICDSLLLLTIFHDGIAGGWNYSLYGILTTPSLIKTSTLYLAGSSADGGGVSYTSCIINNDKIEIVSKLYKEPENKKRKLKVINEYFKINCESSEFTQIYPAINNK